MSYSSIGKRVPRLDASLQIAGQSIYADDISKPDMLYAKALRSGLPHARIVHLDVSRAVHSPGVVSVLTAEDVPNNRWGFSHLDQPVLCDTVVRYSGDPVAAVAAVSEDAAEEALSLIKVDYDPLPAVFDPIDAMYAESPKIHGNSNVAAQIKIRFGDIQAGWKEADEIVEETFKTQRVQHCHLEPHVAIADVGEDGRLIVYSSLQRVFRIAQDLSQILRIPEDRIIVKTAAVGGGFGSKTEVSVEPIVCLFAIKTRRPVKMIFSRREEFLAAPIRHSFVAKYRSGIKRDGRIVARQIELIGDTGAYVSQGQSVLAKAAINACGPYRIPNVRVDGYLIYTNTNIGSAMRGFGVPQVAFAYESHTDTLARSLGMDPLNFRLINLLEDGAILPTGQPLGRVAAKDTLLEACKLAGWNPEGHNE
jgi:CO/xanthine dehydrogenase Mo-binding subunit